MKEGREMIFTVYSLVCAFLPCMVYQLIFMMRERKIGRERPVAHFIWVYIFVLYLWMVFQVTGVGVLGDVLRKDTNLIIGGINLVPFDSFGIGFVLNIIMCMPLGFLLPLIWKECRKCGKTVLIGLIFSLMIEITQLFNWRASDIDDLMANTCGALIGYLVWRIFAKIFGERLKTASEEKYEALIYILLALLGTFFLYNPYLVFRYLAI